MSKIHALWWLARLGYWARGAIYLAIGWLAAAAALTGTRPPSLRGALSTTTEQPLGLAAMLSIALGLFGYAFWRCIQAVLDLHGVGTDLKGLAKRAGMLISALLHAGIGMVAAAVVADWGVLAGSHGPMAERWAALLLDWPLGRWLIAVVGIGAIGLGMAQLAKLRGTAFRDIWASQRTMHFIRPLGTVGLVAKGIVFGLTGTMFLLAAWHAKAGEAGGLRDAFRALGAAPLGHGLFFGVAAGLIVFGIFSILKGCFHRRPEP